MVDAQCRCVDEYAGKPCRRPTFRDGYCDYCWVMYPCDHSALARATLNAQEAP